MCVLAHLLTKPMPDTKYRKKYEVHNVFYALNSKIHIVLDSTANANGKFSIDDSGNITVTSKLNASETDFYSFNIIVSTAIYEVTSVIIWK